MMKTKFSRPKKRREARIFKGFGRFVLFGQDDYICLGGQNWSFRIKFSFMRKFLLLLAFCMVGSLMAVSTSSCNRGVGCPANENAHVKPNRNGELPTKGGSSQLFPKKYYKQKKRRRKN
jgi:hypothetical protein